MHTRRHFLHLAAVAVATSMLTRRLHAAPPASHGRPTQSLAGEWRFALDPTDAGLAESWFNRDLTDRIELPGILQSQGYGNAIATDTPWVLGLGDAWWKLQDPALREHFSQPGKVEVPFLSQPARHYLGAAWYQRDIDIPASAAGQRTELFLERPHWETTVWIDDRPLPSQRSLVAPHVFDLGVLPPGRHRLTLRIDNRQIVREPKNDGHGTDSHAVSDALGATWNGVVGRIELSTTPLVWIEDAQLHPDATTRSARLVLTLGNASGQPGRGHLTAGTQRFEVAWEGAVSRSEFTLDLADTRTWDAFRPVLHRLALTVATPLGADSRTLTYGLRRVCHVGRDFLINDRPVNLRLAHFGCDFPLTGYPATDVTTWKHIFQVCLDYGLNGMRFHSCCPPEAAFVAADEMGFYLQPELGLWAPFNPDGAYTRFLAEETPKLLAAYGNHPSFILLSPSNEPAGRYRQITPQWAAETYRSDPRRLYSAGTGWSAPEQVTDGAQYATLVAFNKARLRGEPGWFGRDYRAALEGVEIPVFSHEIGQWCAYPDFDIIDAFTGHLRPSNYRIFRHIAEKNGVLEYNRAFAYASGRFQLACYKEDIEAALRTPGLSGYQMLDLRDYLGQGTALIGVVDAFWRPKSYVSAREFRRFNQDTVPLARLATRTFTTDETLSAEVELYHFGAAPLKDARPTWKLVGTDGHVMIEGAWPARDVPLGKNHGLGRVEIPLVNLPAPAAYRLVVGLAGTVVENDWNIWVYPSNVDAGVPAGVLLTSDWSAAEAQLASGGRVVFTPANDALDPALSPPMKQTPVFWNIQMTVRPPVNATPRFDAMLGLLVEPSHPALAAFPTEVNCDWQWTPLIDDVRSINLGATPRALKPIVAAIDDWNRNWRLGVVFESTVGSGRLLVCAIDLDPKPPKATPGLRQLRRSLLDYAAGAAFAPATAVPVDVVRELVHPATRHAGPDTKRNFDATLDDGSFAKPPAKK